MLFQKLLLFNGNADDSVPPPPPEVPNSLEEPVTTLSHFFDMALIEARHALMDNGLEPVKVPPIEKDFALSFVSSKINVTNLTIYNVSNFSRQTEIETDYHQRILTFKIPISISGVKIFANYEIFTGGVNITAGTIIGHAGDIDLSITMNLDFAKLKFTFIDFEIPKSDDITITFKTGGISLDKRLLNAVSPIVIKLFKSTLLDIIRTTVMEEMGKLMDILNNIIAATVAEFQTGPLST